LIGGDGRPHRNVLPWYNLREAEYDASETAVAWNSETVSRRAQDRRSVISQRPRILWGGLTLPLLTLRQLQNYGQNLRWHINLGSVQTSTGQKFPRFEQLATQGTLSTGQRTI
jgi:hypothetical protein